VVRAEIDSIVIYVDSGAGQSMCSCSSAFADSSHVKLKLPEWPEVFKFMVVGQRSFSSMTIQANLLFYVSTIASMARDSLIY
jgi:hypothetical protein